MLEYDKPCLLHYNSSIVNRLKKGNHLSEIVKILNEEFIEKKSREYNYNFRKASENIPDYTQNYEKNDIYFSVTHFNTENFEVKIADHRHINQDMIVNNINIIQKKEKKILFNNPIIKTDGLKNINEKIKAFQKNGVTNPLKAYKYNSDE